MAYSGIVESHAYQSTVQGNTAYIADAAANAVLKVNLKTRAISTVAVLPAPAPIVLTPDLVAALNGAFDVNLPSCLVGHQSISEPVPTDVSVGEDGYLYVTTLGGALGEVLPQGAVPRINPWTGAVKTLVTGLAGATGIDTASNGDIYVAQLFGGKVSVIRHGTRIARTLFEAPNPADVSVQDHRVVATTNVFGNGTLVEFHDWWQR